MSEIPEFIEQDPVSYDSNEPLSWYQVWINAITKPNEENFRNLLAQPNAKASTAYLWIFISYMITFVVIAIVQVTVGLPNMAKQFSELGMGEFPVGNVGSSLLGLICGAPFAAALSIFGFMIGVALVQWSAKIFGGTGSYDKLAYLFGAIQAPMMLASSIFILLGMIPFVGLCFGVVSMGLSIYMLVLQVLAVKAVNNFDTGKAIGSIFLPGLVVFILICCCVFLFSALLAPIFGDAFNQLSQGIF